MGCPIPDDPWWDRNVAWLADGRPVKEKRRMATVKMRLMKAAKAGGRA